MTSQSQVPIQIHVDPSLLQYTISLTQFLRANPRYTNLVVSAFIFDAHETKTCESGRPPRLLILQRAAHEGSFANLWEIPGGSSDTNDPTILHSLAREVFEETGLKLTRLMGRVGDVVEFRTGWGSRQKSWAKLSFEIEVAEIKGCDRHGAPAADHKDSRIEVPSQSEGSEVADGMKAEVQEVVVTIDPKEHQKYAWATLEDIKTGKYTITTHEQRDLITKAFQARDMKTAN